MKNLFKKIGALLVAAVMVLAMASTAFAAEATAAKPTATDSKQVKITNVESGATVTAYKLVKADYNAFGFTGYSWTELANKGDETVFNADGKLNITDVNVTDIAKGITKTTTGTVLTLGADGTSTEALTVGTYLILVTGGSEKIYNPMLVSVYYTDGNKMTTEPLDAKSNWGLKTENAYAKSSEIKITKTVNEKSAPVGGTVEYTITGTIPSYSKEYTEDSLKYTMTDKVENLEIDTEKIKVTVGGAKIDSSNYKLNATVSGFELKFKANYIAGLRNETDTNRAVVVTYSAKLTEGASNFDAAHNEVVLDYTHNPGQSEDGKKAETNTYTFDINGQIAKVDATNEETKLGGAEFTLYSDKKLEKVVNTAISADNTGSVVFKGLKEGTYYLKETKAPSTYQITDNVYKIEIKAEYENDDTNKLKNYTVTITNQNDKNDSHTATYDSAEKAAKVEVLTMVKNTKLGTLPSTGGMGTYLFTIIGVVVMAGAAGAFFISRRKGSEE